ncbi:hypothetical protein [Fusobacterium mortiferum]|nr:hypothetical protein [uncultured Fusobacterium sp.]
MEYKISSNKRNKKEVYINIYEEEIDSNMLISRLAKDLFGV